MRHEDAVKKEPKQLYRVEGIGRRGVIRYVKVIGSPGLWKIVGLNGLRLEVPGRTIEDAVRIARRRLPFRPLVIRPMDGDTQSTVLKPIAVPAKA